MRIQRENSLFLASWELDSENLGGVLEKARDLRKIMKERPGEFPRPVCGPYTSKEGGKGFQVFEADPVILDNLMNFWFPEIALSFEPITETKLWEIKGSQPQATKGLQGQVMRAR